MKDRIKVYIEKEVFERFILNEKSFNNLLAIFSEHSVMCINMTDDEIDKEWQMASLDGQRAGSKIRKFCTGHSMRRPLSANSDFMKFLSDNNKFLDYSRSVFVLNVSPEEAERLRNKYGLVILSKDNLSDDIFQFHIKDSVFKGELKDGFLDGWDYFFNLRKQDWLPSNVLIFSDEHLFKNEERGKNLGVRNLKSIITHLLPQKLDTEFQILVVSPIPKNNRLKAQRISDEMTKFVHGLPLSYSCKITFVFTDSIHTRKALSNYYVMTCDKGFCVYLDSPGNQVYDTNFVDITSNFHSAADSAGTNGYDDTTMCLNDIKKYCKEAQEQARAGITTVLISGDCGPNFEIYNRLFE
ncbi:MAG: hypothetical protein IKR71_04755 [Bacteroidales bacterium]|nr:hypothetical protein [Bacteroidales bacterium]